MKRTTVHVRRVRYSPFAACGTAERVQYRPRHMSLYFLGDARIALVGQPHTADRFVVS